MPDLTIEIMQQCASTDGPTVTHEGGYTQTGMFSERNWPECDCPAYKFSKRKINFGGRMVPERCKHIIAAEEKACSYHQQLDGPPKIDGICPKCGDTTVLVKVAV
jgi:hypothetical protein